MFHYFWCDCQVNPFPPLLPVLCLIAQDWPPKFDSFEKIFYFWMIYVGANLVWITVPVSIMLTTLFEMDTIYNGKTNAKNTNRSKKSKIN